MNSHIKLPDVILLCRSAYDQLEARVNETRRGPLFGGKYKSSLCGLKNIEDPVHDMATV